MADVIDALIAEALGEGPEGIAAVAHVIQARAMAEGKTPDQIINESGQFSGVTNPGRVVAQSMRDPAIRAQVAEIWSGVQSGSIPNPYPGATHFHTPAVSPDWSRSFDRLGQKGNHIFYADGSAPSNNPVEPSMLNTRQEPDTSWLRYSNQGATRSQPISPDLVNAMSFLPEMGVTMDVYSGGQPAKGEGARVGSTRHDHGNAADVMFYKDGRMLDWNNPDDIPVLSDIVARAKSSGVTGIGAGDDYMGAGRIHIGFGDPAVWGAGGRSANAPDWLKSAYYGTPASGPAVKAINAAAPQAKPTGIFGSAWSGITGGLGGLKQAAGEKVRGIMGSPPPHVQKQIMNMAMGSLPVRTAFVRSLMNQNIGSAPTARQGNVPGGSRVSAVGPNGVSPMTLMGSTNAGSQAFDQSVHAGQDMNVYRANRAAVGGPITQSSINNALSEGRTLYKSR